MPQTLSYPGIYIEEIPSPVHTITAVPTAVAAFAGRAIRGLVNQPVRIHSAGDFDRAFGGLWAYSELGQAVQQYFANGGGDAFVVRVCDAASYAAFQANPPRIDIPTSGGATLQLVANSPGTWINNLGIVVDLNTRKVGTPPAVVPGEFNLTLTLTETDPVTGLPRVTTESYRNLTFDASQSEFIATVLTAESQFVSVGNAAALVVGDSPVASPTDPVTQLPVPYTRAANPGGSAPGDGTMLAWSDLVPGADPGTKAGIYALELADIFTMLVIPGYSPQEQGAPDRPLDATTWGLIAAYCESRRAMALVDPQSTWIDEPTAYNQISGGAVDNIRFDNTVLYYPFVMFGDPLDNGRGRYFSPSAAVAGIWSRTDADRGVWKAPAGEEAKIVGAQQLQYKMTDKQNGDLNPLGIDCLRTFPILGSVVWGARTLYGADAQASEWKYLSIRRTAYFIEESLYRGTTWIVFEPNDEPLWSQIRLNVDAFMRNLFRQGAFQGATPSLAYFVKCDSDTTTQTDIDNGIVNILVGFAPLKPAEFVVIKISQLTAQASG